MVKSSVPEDNTQDAMVLLEYYREHKPELATEAKVAQIIQTFRAKAGATAKASINSIGPSWRELMYDSITLRSGRGSRCCRGLGRAAASRCECQTSSLCPS